MASRKRKRQRERRLKGQLATDLSGYGRALTDAVTNAIVEEAATATAVDVRGALVPVDESALRSDGTVPLRLISPGWGTSGFYSADVLEAAGNDGVFAAGCHCYWDHPSITEQSDRPERSLRDLAAVLETTGTWRTDHPDGPGIYAEARVFGPYRELLAEMAPHIGVSIRAAAQVSTGEADGRRGRIVEEIVEAQSVDFVTRPGRGGQVLAILEAHRPALAEAMADDLRQALRTALGDRFPEADGSYVWVRDFDPDDQFVVFDREGKAVDNPGTFRLSFTTDGDGAVTLADDDPVEVRVQTTYTPVTEARNVGEWFQSRIHLHFTTLADDMFGEGRLTKDERIALSNAIGGALDAFSQLVDDNAPQLLTRDLWDEPTPATPVTESQEDDMPLNDDDRKAIGEMIQTAVAPIAEAVGKLAPPEPSGTEDVSEAERAERAETALVVRDARDHVAEALGKVEGLPAPTVKRLTESLTDPARVPFTDDRKLDTAKLDEALKTAVETEVKYLSEATGSPVRGVGGGDTTTGGDDDASRARLEEAFKGLGLSEDSAKVAAAGRGR